MNYQNQKGTHMNKRMATLALAAAFSTGIASAQTTYHAVLTGLQEVPANASTATGSGTVVLNAAQNLITVDESWTGLTTAATASPLGTLNSGAVWRFD